MEDGLLVCVRFRVGHDAAQKICKMTGACHPSRFRDAFNEATINRRESDSVAGVGNRGLTGSGTGCGDGLRYLAGGLE